MKYFLDTEFLEGTQTKRFLGIPYGETLPTIDLISIGIVAEDGREYYAISKDFNLKEAWNRFEWKQRNKEDIQITPALGCIYKEYWIRENVLKPIHEELCNQVGTYGKTYHSNLFAPFTYKSMKTLLQWYGKTNEQIAEEIKDFVNLPQGYELKNIAKERKKPSPDLKGFKKEHLNWTPIEFYAYYADYDWVAFCWLFGKMINLPKGFPMYCIDLKQELDRVEEYELKRGGILRPFKELNVLPKQTNEHNALADAKWNKELHKFLNNI
jgi:hypothetical protein